MLLEDQFCPSTINPWGTSQRTPFSLKFKTPLNQSLEIPSCKKCHLPTSYTYVRSGLWEEKKIKEDIPVKIGRQHYRRVLFSLYMRATLRRAWEKQSGWFQPHPSRKRKILAFRPLGIPPAPSPSFCVRKYTFLALIYNSNNSNSKRDNRYNAQNEQNRVQLDCAHLKVPRQLALKTYASIAPLPRQHEWCFTLSWHTYLWNGRISCFLDEIYVKISKIFAPRFALPGPSRFPRFNRVKRMR